MWNRLLRNLTLLIVLVPVSAHAVVSITEIMYDPSGSDDGHEWVEVYNDGASFDLSEWKLFEGGSNHGITAYAGGSMLATGSYAVLADNPQKFLADWSNFSGQIFDTVFSGGLNNSNGETLVVRNDSLVDIDTVTYGPTLGANGDGNSLQKVGSSFTPLLPTPGLAASGSLVTSETSGLQNASTSETDTSTAVHSSVSSYYPVDPQMGVSGGVDRTVVAGASTVFEARAYGLKGQQISNVRFVWNFGNGDRAEGASVLYAFSYPGVYAVVLDASSELMSATARFKVVVVPAEVSITKVTEEIIEITNASKKELDLGLWQLSADGILFRFPPHTLIFPKESVSVSNKATGLTPSSPDAVSLLYPDGTLAASYGGRPLIVQRASAAVSSKPVIRVAQNKESAVSENLANVSASTLTGSLKEVPGLIPWLLGVFGVIVIGVGTLLLARPRKGSTTGYRIIEEE